MPAAGKVTIGLASHWPCQTDISGSPSTAQGLEEGDNKWSASILSTPEPVLGDTVQIKNRSKRSKHFALAVVRRSQKFCPAADPLPGGAGRPKFNQLEMVNTFTYRPSLVRIDAHNFELSW